MTARTIPAEEVLDLRDLFRGLARNWWLVLVLGVLGAAWGWHDQTPYWQARAVVGGLTGEHRERLQAAGLEVSVSGDIGTVSLRGDSAGTARILEIRLDAVIEATERARKAWIAETMARAERLGLPLSSLGNLVSELARPTPWLIIRPEESHVGKSRRPVLMWALAGIAMACAVVLFRIGCEKMKGPPPDDRHP